MDVVAWLQRTMVDGYELPAGPGLSCGLFDRDRNPRPVVAVLSEAVAASAPAVIEPDPDPDAQERPR